MARQREDISQLPMEEAIEKAADFMTEARRMPANAWDLGWQLKPMDLPPLSPLSKFPPGNVTLPKELHAYEWGDAGNPAVLLVHGMEGRSLQLGKFGPALAGRGLRVVAVDMPGHGKTWPDGPKLANPLLFAQTLLHIAWCVIGHSLGSAATTLAVSRGFPTKRMVLISPPAGQAHSLARSLARMELKPEWAPQVRAAVEKRIGGNMDDLSVMKAAAAIKIPTLVVHDTEDALIPVEEARAVVKVFPNKADYMETTGLGHGFVLRDDAVVNRVVTFASSGVEAKYKGLPKLPQKGRGVFVSFSYANKPLNKQQHLQGLGDTVMWTFSSRLPQCLFFAFGLLVTVYGQNTIPSTVPSSNGAFDVYHTVVNAILISIGVLLFASSLLIAGIIAFSRLRGETSRVNSAGGDDVGLPPRPMRRKDVAFFEAQAERKERNIYNYRPDGYNNKTLYEMAQESAATNAAAAASQPPEMTETRNRGSKERSRPTLPGTGDLGESNL
ncbi:hypothetical protein SmJEL517_g02229 [Synchytrium microbalum]|uniref:AB hydrolase-1 domain-containing protein n=1 Tax=Synchytrium microbalum TaxID=1806994 RepID=A0A507C8A1_9FUNG|nr:uncharacterized protein SmJEL517_g02229 [Synchytrium microbalum]TPX35369.1 hypothetical protein SmJEL517_g02229 [Synchytrium microbalum]